MLEQITTLPVSFEVFTDDVERSTARRARSTWGRTST